MPFTPQNFVNQQGPAVSANWLNGVDVTVNYVLGGAQTVAQAQAALGIPVISVPVPVAEGGTGATTPAAGLTALGGTTLAAVEAALTQSYLGAVFNPRTAAEIAAGITPTLYQYPPGQVERYGAANSNAATPLANNATAIQAAFSVFAAGGPLPAFLPGSYAITAVLIPPANMHLNLMGADIAPNGSCDAFDMSVSNTFIMNGSITLTNTTGMGIYAANAIQQFYFADLVINGGSGMGIQLVNCYTGIIARVKFILGTNTGLYITSNVASTPTNSICIEDCFFLGMTGTTPALHIDGAAGIWVNNPNFQSNVNAGGSADISITANTYNGTSTVVITGGYWETASGYNSNGSSCISVAGNATNNVTGVIIERNYMQTSKQMVAISTYVANDITIKDNKFNAVGTYAGYGITVPAGFIPNAYNNSGSVADINRAFTPTLSLGGAAVGMTGAFSGYYRRQDNKVSADIQIVLTALGSSTGSVAVNGLPIASSANSISGQAQVVSYSAMASLTSAPFGTINPSQSAFYLSEFGAVASANLTNANLTNTSTLTMHIEYEC